MTLNGKVALITGAKGGLGSPVTNAFLAAGATVAGVSRSIRASDFDDPKFFAVPAELSNSAAARTVVDAVLARAGQIDILVHLVGGFKGGQAVADTDDCLLEEMFEANVKSAFYMAKAVLGHMRDRGAGRIIAIGSRAAVESNGNVGAYSASKAALIALIRAIASENAKFGITANIILPGTMDTAANRRAMPNADFKNWVQLDQVATLIVSLASDELSQVTGASIPIYGCDI